MACDCSDEHSVSCLVVSAFGAGRVLFFASHCDETGLTDLRVVLPVAKARGILDELRAACEQAERLAAEPPPRPFPILPGEWVVVSRDDYDYVVNRSLNGPLIPAHIIIIPADAPKERTG